MNVRRTRTFYFVYLIARCLPSLSLRIIPECAFDSDATWIPFGNKWYTFISAPGNGYTINKALEICQEIAPGANIVSVLNEKENQFIVDQFKKTVQPETIWLGMTFDTDSSTMRWFDESKVNYSNWASGELPGEIPDTDTCVIMDTESGKWKTVDCDEDFGRSVTCETTTIAVPDGEKCSKGRKNNVLPTALIISAAAILVIISIITWYAYKRKCLTANGHNSIQYHPTDQVADDCVLVENEEREYEA
ncbi:CD302 antigen isoform X1 [Rhincodon typus]|uniref:CD302 antigen isoform X1 n=1 Tax=Rhincodon typus TaxID=259920 RepID=UPI0009A2B285|nr:CD302 antigen isoform X1 [Rhincodon typus]